jgi:ribosomal protein S6--L-glutamate ligase
VVLAIRLEPGFGSVASRRLSVVFLAKQRHASKATLPDASEATLRRFIDLGVVRGHDVQWRDKASLAPADLEHAHVVCMKSHIDSRHVWELIEAQGVRAVNTRAACASCSDRLVLDTVLRAGGVCTPRCARSATEVPRLRYPVVRKPNPMSAPRDVRVLEHAPEQVDCERWFYQELVEGGGVVHKAYCIGTETFLLTEQAPNAMVQTEPLRSAEQPMSAAMADATRTVGRLTGLEVYGVDFIARADDLHVIDVNPFPSFRGLPRAADALWDHLERVA